MVSASLANRCAKTAKLLRILAITGHELNGKDADVNTIPQSLDTLGPVLCIWFLQAGSQTLFTRLQAFHARFNALLISI